MLGYKKQVHHYIGYKNFQLIPSPCSSGGQCLYDQHPALTQNHELLHTAVLHPHWEAGLWCYWGHGCWSRWDVYLGYLLFNTQQYISVKNRIKELKAQTYGASYWTGDQTKPYMILKFIMSEKSEKHQQDEKGLKMMDAKLLSNKSPAWYAGKLFTMEP